MWKYITGLTGLSGMSGMVGSAAYFESTIAGLSLLLDPTFGCFTERTGASATTACTDGDPIGTWKTRNGLYLIAPSNGARPTWNANGGKPYAAFDGVGTRLSVASGVGGPQPITVVAALRRSDASFRYLFSAADGFGCALSQGVGGDDALFMYAGSASTPSGATNFGSDQVASAKYNGAASKLWENGTLRGTGNPGANAATTGLVVGNRYDAALPWSGRLYRLALYVADPA